LWLSTLVLDISQAHAQPKVYNLAPEALLSQGEPLGSKQQSLAELDQVLREPTQAKLEELSGAHCDPGGGQRSAQ
jgi:hypothetical protein